MKTNMLFSDFLWFWSALLYPLKGLRNSNGKVHMIRLARISMALIFGLLTAARQ